MKPNVSVLSNLALLSVSQSQRVFKARHGEPCSFPGDGHSAEGVGEAAAFVAAQSRETAMDMPGCKGIAGSGSIDHLDRKPGRALHAAALAEQ